MKPRLEAILDKLRKADLATCMDVTIDGPNVRGPSFGDTPLHIFAIGAMQRALVY